MAFLPCGNCGRDMQAITLAGHYGRVVELDLCAPCHLVWFDQTETARLTGSGLLDLIAAMAAAQSLPHEVLRADARCPRCSGRLDTVHNRSRWGESLQLQCHRRHGAYQSFAQFLQEKGLLRPMSGLDRAQMLQQRGHIDCVNCGSSIGASDAQCPHCQSVPSLLDIARLAHALDPEDAIAPQAVHATRASAAAMQCGACGAALPPERSMACNQCGATLAVSRLVQAHECVAALAPALLAHEHRPSAEVVKRRMAKLEADIPRRRAWVQQMEADAPGVETPPSLRDQWSDFRPWQARLGLILFLAWLAWRFW